MLKCVNQIEKIHRAAEVANKGGAQERNVLEKAIVYKDRLRICVESLLHFT